MHTELENMVAAGMTPAQVLVGGDADVRRRFSASTISARSPPGKSADFVVLDANPLDDITNTRRISQVYLRGTRSTGRRLRARWTGGPARLDRPRIDGRLPLPPGAGRAGLASRPAQGLS